MKIKYVEVYAQPPVGLRWKVGQIHNDEYCNEKWVKECTGIVANNIYQIVWSNAIDAWIIKLKK